jgi:hypothetical protein
MVVTWADGSELGKTALRKILVGKKEELCEGRSLWTTSPKIRTLFDIKHLQSAWLAEFASFRGNLFACVLPSVYKFPSVRQISLTAPVQLFIFNGVYSEPR